MQEIIQIKHQEFKNPEFPENPQQNSRFFHSWQWRYAFQ